MQASASTPAAAVDQAKPEPGAVRPFGVDIPEEDLEDLRRRIAATRWPCRELVDDRSQGVQLATMQELTRYWATEHDWHKCEEKLNALPQSPHEDALPLIITHGWPGSVIELLEVAGPFRAQFKKGYIAEQGQTPQTIGYILTDSSIGLAAWMLDHDSDAYEKISRAFVDGNPSGGLTRDSILDNITLYWFRAAGHRLRGSTGSPNEAQRRRPGRCRLRSLSQPRLLQRGRQGRPLRGLGGAGALLRRAPGSVQLAALIGANGRPAESTTSGA
jgi:hypothetical protein